MTEFLKDFNYVKKKIDGARNLNQVIECDQLVHMFINKYVVQVSHMDPILIQYSNALRDSYQKKFKEFSSCI